jgi:fibronectin-binding autotransporter adhesin
MKTTPTHSSEEKATPISRTGSGWLSISRSACLLAIPFSLLLGAGHAFGQGTGGAGGGHTWLGTSSTDFFDTANWNTGNWPNGIANYGPDGGANTTVVRSSQTYTYQYGIQFTNTTDTNGSYDISGTQAFDFKNFGVRTSIMSSGTLNEVIHNDIIRNGEYGYETGAGHDLTLNGVISSGTDLIKKGDGTLYLNGANTYTGATFVNAGTLTVANSSALGGSGAGTTVASGATLRLENGVNITSEALTLSGSLFGATNPSSVEYGGAITLGGDASISAGGSNAMTISGTIDGGGNQLTLTNAAPTITVSGVLSNASLVKSGTGTAILSGANTYTGATFVNAGTLKLGNNSALGTTAGATTVASGAAIDTAGFDPANENFTINGTGTDGAGGRGALYSTANSTSFAATTVITLGSDTEIGGGGGRVDNLAEIDGGGFNLTKVGTENWYNWSGNASNIGTLIVDTGAFMGLPSAALANAASNGVQVKENAHVQTWGTGQDFTSAWTFENGSKFTNDWGAANASTHEISGDITLNGTVQFGANSNAGVNRVTTLSGAIGGAGALVKTGLHELVLTGGNSFTGDTLINAGTLKISGSGQLGSGSYAGAISNSGVFEYNSSATQTLSGVISGGGELVVSAGTLILSNDTTASSYTIAPTATLELSSGASLTANTAFSGTGTLEVTGSVNLGAISGTFSMGSGAYIDIKSGGQIISNGGNDPWTGSLADVNVDGLLYVANNNLNADVLTGSGLLQMGTSTINLGVDNGTGGVFNGDIRRSYANAHLDKQGTGTQTLNGEVNLGSTGTVTVSEGTLIFNGTSSGTNATGSWTVENGATLSGSGTLSGTATIGDGATLSPGNSPGTQTFDNLTWVNSGTYLWEINADLASGGGEGVDSGWDWIDVTNTFDLSGITTGFNIDITSLTNPGNIAGLADGFNYTGKTYLDPFESFTILSFGSLTGTFDASEFNLLTGNFANSKVDWNIDIVGNDLVLNAVFVPEPSSTALLGLGGLALMLRRKRS